MRGPQTFTFYRLWENFKALVRNSTLYHTRGEIESGDFLTSVVTATTVHDFALINTLVECRLLQQASSATLNPRYRCLAPKDVVEICAKTVGITLDEHLVSS